MRDRGPSLGEENLDTAASLMSVTGGVANGGEAEPATGVPSMEARFTDPGLLMRSVDESTCGVVGVAL